MQKLKFSGFHGNHLIPSIILFPCIGLSKNRTGMPVIQTFRSGFLEKFLIQSVNQRFAR